MANSQSKAEAYSNVVERATLVNLMLTSSSFVVAPTYQDEAAGALKFMDQSIEDDVAFDAEQKLLMGTIRCRIWMAKKPEGVEGKPSPEEMVRMWDDALLAIEANYTVFFEVPGEHDDDVQKAFFNRVATFAAWPYFRQHVAALASEAAIKIPMLPIKKMTQPVRATNPTSEEVPHEFPEATNT